MDHENQIVPSFRKNKSELGKFFKFVAYAITTVICLNMINFKVIHTFSDKDKFIRLKHEHHLKTDYSGITVKHEGELRNIHRNAGY